MTRETTHNNNFISRHPDVLACLLLIVLTVSVYWQVKNHDFINFDDDQYVTDNRHVQTGFSFKNITWAFTTVHTGNWHPLTWLSHMLDCRLFGLNPGWHHLSNLFFHIINTLLLFIVFRKMTGNLWQSGFVAALFALHPLHVESVAWISERKDVLSTLFWMLTILSYIYYVKAPGTKRYLLVFLLLTLGLMSKPMLVTIPFVLILLDYWPLNRISVKQTGSSDTINRSSVRRIFIEKIPLFALIAIFSAATFLAQKHGGAVSSLDAMPINTRVANALVSYAAYIVKMIWPSNMAVLYPHPGTIAGWKIVLSCIFLISISYLAIRSVRKRPYFAVGWFWYIGTLVPVIGIVQVGIQAMADRYTYIPLIGIFIIISWGISEIITRWNHIKTPLIAITTVILFILMPITFLQAGYWKSSITLFEHALDVTSNNYIPHNNLGIALEDQRRTEEAMEHFSEALRINPDFEKAHYNLGLNLQNQGRTDEAIKHYLDALHVNPDYGEAHYNMGLALQKQGRTEEAMEHFSEALRINPDFEKAHNNMGLALQKQGRTEEAMEHFSEALRVNFDYEEAHNNLGNALKNQGRTDEAIKHYLEALRINPEFEETHYNLGNALQKQGRTDEAIKHYLEALRINPEFWETHYNLGNALKNQGRTDEAIKHYLEALRINPEFEEAYNNLGVALLRKRNINGAIACFRKALQINPDSVDAKNILSKLLMIKKQGKF